MRTSSKISERLAVDVNIAVQDLVTQRTGSYVEAGLYRRFLGKAYCLSVTQNSTLTVRFVQAQDANGTGVKNLGDAVVATAGVGGGALSAEVEAEVSDLDVANGFTHIALRAAVVDAASPDGTIYGGAVLLQDGGRFSPS